MRNFFIDSGYPSSLVSEVFSKILAFDRIIRYRDQSSEEPGKFGVPWISTYGPGHGDLKHYVAKTNKILKASPIFNDLLTPVLGVVFRRAPSLRDQLFNQKTIGLGIDNHSGGKITTRCTPMETKKVGRPCEWCDLMSGEDHICIDQSLKCSGGTCLSFNVVYAVQCLLCLLGYIGKTIQATRTRISNHRGFMTTLDANNPSELDDESTLAAHLIYDHNLTTKSDFNNSYKFYIL